MKRTKVVGLTGGIGSGKSSVLQLFKNKGVTAYVADMEAKNLMQHDENLMNKIIQAFGEKSYENGVLNRVFLANEVFKNTDKLKILSSLVHPAVQKHFKQFLKEINDPFMIYENAILFENGFDKNCDYIITVTATKELKISRVMERDSFTKQQVLDRMHNQWEDEAKIQKSDFVIENIDWQNTVKQVEDIYSKLVKLTQKKP